MALVKYILRDKKKKRQSILRRNRRQYPESEEKQHNKSSVTLNTRKSEIQADHHNQMSKQKNQESSKRLETLPQVTMNNETSHQNHSQKVRMTLQKMTKQKEISIKNHEYFKASFQKQCLTKTFDKQMKILQLILETLYK